MSAKSQRIRAWAVAQAKKERENALLEQVTARLEGTDPRAAARKQLADDFGHMLDALVYAHLTGKTGALTPTP